MHRVRATATGPSTNGGDYGSRAVQGEFWSGYLHRKSGWVGRRARGAVRPTQPRGEQGALHQGRVREELRQRAQEAGWV